MQAALHVIIDPQAFSGQIVGTVTLDFDNRRRRRIRLSSDQGMDFLLNLSDVATLREGDILVLDNGDGVEVKAAPEAVVDVTCTNVDELVRVAWHLGNRHLPTQLLGDRLRIRQDHVIEDMLTILGATPVRLDAPFNPEGGAYGHGETHGHDHDHSGAPRHSHDH